MRRAIAGLIATAGASLGLAVEPASAQWEEAPAPELAPTTASPPGTAAPSAPRPTMPSTATTYPAGAAPEAPLPSSQPVATQAPVSVPPAPLASEQPPRPEREEEAHRGGFLRLTLGGGLGWVGGGSLMPEPGFRPVPDLSHSAPVLGVALQLGVGGSDLAVAGELYHERMLVRLKEPSVVGFSLWALGLAVSYYFDRDWFLTGHLRWVHLALWRPEVPCWYDRADGSGGPGVGLTAGKEWFGDDANAVGLALQVNYATLRGSPELDTVSGLVLLTFTHF